MTISALCNVISSQVIEPLQVKKLNGQRLSDKETEQLTQLSRVAEGVTFDSLASLSAVGELKQTVGDGECEAVENIHLAGLGILVRSLSDSILKARYLEQSSEEFISYQKLNQGNGMKL